MFYILEPTILPQVRLMDAAVICPPFIHRQRQADEYILYFIRKGLMYLSENGTEHILREGDMYLLSPAYAHEGYRSSYCEYFYIHFRHGQLNEWFEKVGVQELMEIRQNALQSEAATYDMYGRERILLPRKHQVADPNTRLKLMDLLAATIDMNRTQAENYKIYCSCRFLEFLIEVSRSFISAEIGNMASGVPKSYQKVTEIFAFLNASYPQKITSERIEAYFDCNFDYINRSFKGLTGQTIFQYLNRVRIRRAKELISNTTMKMAEIGEAVGYPDEYYFSKVFKKHTGVSPVLYAKQMLKK